MPKKHTVRRYIVPIILILISILFFIFMIKSKPAPIQNAAPERAWSVDSLTVHKKNHTPVLQLYGQVITSMDIQLTASIEADVNKRYVNVGDMVKKDQLLLSLDKTRFEQLRLQRKAELTETEMQITAEKHQFETDTALLKHEKSLLEIANSALKRAKTLEKSAMASDSQLDDAKRTSIQQKLSITQLKANLANHPSRLAQLQAKRQQALSRLALAEDDLQQTRILSPIDGVITEVSVDNAEHVQKGTALFSISDTGNIEIQSLVPQTQYKLLRETLRQNQLQNQSNHQGNKQNSKINAIVQTRDASLQATLTRLSATINKGQAGSFAFFHINKQNKKQSNTDASLLIGQTVTVSVELSPQTNTIALPQDAIYGTDSVFLIEQQRLKRVNIHWLGETLNNKAQKWVLIESDNIKDSDEILINKFANAMHGLKVKIKARNNARDAQHEE